LFSENSKEDIVASTGRLCGRVVMRAKFCYSSTWMIVVVKPSASLEIVTVEGGDASLVKYIASFTNRVNLKLT
jgi:hypothetical protein